MQIKYYVFAKHKDTRKVRASCGPLFDAQRANKILTEYRKQYEPEFEVVWRKSEIG